MLTLTDRRLDSRPSEESGVDPPAFCLEDGQHDEQWRRGIFYFFSSSGGSQTSFFAFQRNQCLDRLLPDVERNVMAAVHRDQPVIADLCRMNADRDPLRILPIELLRLVRWVNVDVRHRHRAPQAQVASRAPSIFLCRRSLW